MGSACCKKRSDKNKKEDHQNQKPKTVDEFKFEKSNFIVHKTEKFKDHYIMGKSFGCGRHGEVRKCQHRVTDQKRAVRIIKRETMNTR